MAFVHRWALVCIVAMLLPHTTFAQEDALRAAIRADIMRDPRSAEMSPTEINALVEALAMQAEDQGVAEEYLAAEQNTFDEPAEAPVYQETYTLNTLSIAIAILVVVLLAVAVFLFTHRRKASPEA